MFVESNNGGDVSTITSVKLYGAPNSNTDVIFKYFKINNSKKIFNIKIKFFLWNNFSFLSMKNAKHEVELP